VLVLLIGACVFRIALNVLLPTVLDRIARVYDLELGYDRLNLSLLGGTANLYGLKIRPAGGGDSILQGEYVQGNLSPLNLLRGRLVVHRAEIDGVILAIDREADGSIPLLNRFLAVGQSAGSKTPTAATQPARPISLDAPLRVDAVRLSHVTLRLRDRSVTPVFEAVVQTSLRVSDVGIPNGPTRVELDVGVDPLLDTLQIRGQAHTSPDELKADVKLLLRGLHPPAAAGYLAQLGLRPTARDVTVRADLSFVARTIPNSADFSAKVRVSNVSAIADGQQWASLENLELDAARLSASGVDITKLTLANGLATARRTTDGQVEIAGLAVAPAADAPAVVATTVPSPATPAAPVVVVKSAPPFRFSLGELDLRNLQATVTDEVVAPAATLVARLESMTLRGIDSDPARADAAVPLSLVAALPGVARNVTVHGDLRPFAATKTATLNVTADGVRPEAIAPYLSRHGLQSQLHDARFHADLDAAVTVTPGGATTATAGVTNLRLVDGDASLLTLKTARVDGLTYTRSGGDRSDAASIIVKSIDVTGPGLRIVRDADGRVGASGFKFIPTATAPQQTNAVVEAGEPAASQPAAPAVLPRVQIDRLKWGGAKLVLEDQSAATASTFTFDEAGVDVQDLLIDLQSRTAAKPGRFVAWLAAPGVADALTLSGSFLPGPNRLTVTADVSGEGLTGQRLTPYLKPFGVEPTLVAGRLNASGSATVTQADTGLGLNLEVHDVSYFDGPVELAGVDSFGVNGLSLTSTRVDVDSMHATRPRVRVARDADGSLRLGGVHLIPVVAGPNDIATPTTAPASPVPLRLPALPMAVGIKALRVSGASLDWTDQAAATPVQLRGGIDVSLDALDTAATTPARLKLDATVDDVVRQLTVEGDVVAFPESPSVRLMINAAGILSPAGASRVAGYLPATLQPTLEDARFAARLEAGLSNHVDGGLAANLSATQLDWGDRGGEKALAKVDAFTLNARRIDQVAGVFDVAELSSRGVAAGVERTPDGIELLGLRSKAVPPTTQPEQAAAPTTAPAGPVASLAAMVGDARRPLPLVTLDKLDLAIERLTLGGFTGPGAAPLELADVSITSPGPLSFGGADAESAAPLLLRVAGAARPLTGSSEAVVKLTPFAPEPAATLDVRITGLRGDGVTQLLPTLAGRIDGSGLTDGTFIAHVDASIDYGRRGPRDLDVGRGFVARFDVKPLELRATPDGPVLAGIEAVHGEGIKVEPRTGNVSVKLLEISTPIARAYRDKRGLHAVGMTLLLGADEDAETLTASKAPASQPVNAPAAPTPAERPANEVRLDRLTVSGVDVVLEDRTSTPPTVVPIKTLDVDVQDLSNQLPWNGKPVRFSLLCTADKVDLPPRKGARGEASTRPVAGGGYTERRDLFSQVTASGKVALARNGDTVALDGWAKTSVNGFELLGVRGLAEQYGVTIGGGAFDNTNDIRFNPAGTIETRNRLVFTNLSLSEPADGPLRRLLKLPAPINVAIGAVTDPDGSITMNVPVPIKNGAIRPGDVYGPALGAVANVLVTGIASAPVKAVSGIGQLIGLGNKEVAPEPPVVVRFLPAYTGLDSSAAAQLARLGEAMKKDDALELQLRHTLTDGDAERVAVRANPSPDTALALAERVRQQKQDLQARFAATAAQARGDFGAGAGVRAAAATDALRELGRQITQAEQALDELYALTTPGAAAQADRRTRTAGLDVARQRLEGVTREILRTAGRAAAGRVHATNPQFDPQPTTGGGDVTVVLVRKKQ
jgi:hypothetical protein